MSDPAFNPLRIPAKGPFLRRPARRLPALAERLAAERFAPVRALAARMEALFASVRGVFAEHCPALCPLCPKPCCSRVSRRGVMDETDLLHFAALGFSQLAAPVPGSGCPWLGPAGCVLDWRTRPYACLHYVCPRLERGMHPNELARAGEVFSETARLRAEMMTAYLEAGG